MRGCSNALLYRVAVKHFLICCTDMVERSKRVKRTKKALLGSHQRSWLWGRHLVSETIRAGKWPILELFLAADLPADQLHDVQDLIKRQQINHSLESRNALSKRCHSAEHQGYVAKMGPFPYADVDQVLASRSAGPLYLLLDAIQDPHNFGAILRSAEVFGVEAAFIGDARQVGVTSQVARSSAGAVNRIPIVQTPDLVLLAETLRNLHVKIVAADGKASRTIADYDFRQATAIVIGNEGAGISPALSKCCDDFVKIPQFGRIGSLNAAAAAAILFYEARRQRG